MNTKRFYSLLTIIAMLSLLGAMPQPIQAASPSSYTPGNEPSIAWNTFWGEETAAGDGALVDANGNIYIVGYSGSTWGNPVNPHAGAGEAFAAKFDNNGVLQWNTFLGSASDDQGFGIAMDGSGNIYVSGRSLSSWGNPVNNAAGGYDTFVAKLDNNGILQWNTFLGSAGTDQNLSIAADESGNSYVVGNSDATWGNPVNNHAGGYDSFVAKINTYGELQWNTFLGSPGYDSAAGIAVGKSGNIYVGGDSFTSWGNPVVPFGGGSRDGFVAKLNSGGILIWNTFSGGYYEWARGLALDESENTYIVGFNYGIWGIPIPYVGGDAFAAKFDNNGLMIWSTLLGSSEFDQGFSIALDGKGNVYVTGDSYATWGNPASAYADGSDVFVAKLSSNGSLQWNTFLGAAGYDQGMGIAADGSENAYVTGYSCNTWGTPLHAHPGGKCVLFVAKLEGADTTEPVILPTITGTIGNNDWYTGDVIASWIVSDPESGITSSGGCDATTLTTDTAGVTLTCSATNGVGLSNAVSVTVKIDKTAPVITWTGSINDGDSFYFGSVPPEPTCTVADELSGMDGTCIVSGYASTLGTHTITATARDNAGNVATETRSYTVSEWTLMGFYPPVDMNGVYNVVKGGSTVPLKFEIVVGPVELTDVAFVKSLTYAQTSCDAGATTDEIETTATGGTSLRYDSSAGQFIYNWKTPSTAGKCYRVTMTATDGSSLVAYFKLK